jgi:hypothetical protein
MNDIQIKFQQQMSYLHRRGPPQSEKAIRWDSFFLLCGGAEGTIIKTYN